MPVKARGREQSRLAPTPELRLLPQAEVQAASAEKKVQARGAALESTGHG